jgi:hypothetical protein
MKRTIASISFAALIAIASLVHAAPSTAKAACDDCCKGKCGQTCCQDGCTGSCCQGK